MSLARMRPTFLLDISSPPEEVISCIQDAISKPPLKFLGQFTGQHAIISIVPEQRHFWSPWLHLDFRSELPQKQVFGRFTPNPSIWTGFMFAYLSIAVLVFFCTIFGVSQQIVGEPAWAYYGVPIGIVIAALLWIAAQAGQKLADDEMRRLRSLIETCVNGEPDA